jgi:ergothioneine biosynthesis protein EgtB
MLTHPTSISASSFLKKYQRIRKQTEALCAPLQPEDQVVQPIVDVSPPKWHLGHTTWFFETFLLKEYLPGYQLFHPKFPFFFNSYYEGAGDRMQRSNRGNMTRPTVDEIRAYRAYVDKHMERFLEGQKELSDRVQYILNIGFNHEQQHQELLVYDIKYILGHNPLFPTYSEKAVKRPPQGEKEASYLEMPEGLYEIGYAGPDFHFDNEEGLHQVYLPAYRILDRLVTHGEFREFVEAGGYQDYRFWLSEGMDWVKKNEVDTPFYWFKKDGEWLHYTLQGLQPIDWNEPMTHVNFYEADAFARWKGKRLPTEFEWEAACRTFEPEIPAQANFVEDGQFRPVGRQEGSYQFYGDVWEWTNSAYLPYPFYQAEKSTLGEYNGKWMINQMVLRGGSCATPRDHIRASYRNFFHPHLQWLFNGFRLAEYLGG